MLENTKTKCVDVLAKYSDGRKVAIEIALTSRDYESVNLSKDLECGFDEIIFACRDQYVKETLENKFRANGIMSPKVKFSLVTDYLGYKSHKNG